MTDLFGIYGASGYGRETLPVLRAQLARTNLEIVFIDDSALADNINGHSILTWEAFAAKSANKKCVSLAIANSQVRELLAEKCKSAGVGFVQVRAANVVEFDNVIIGEGAILSPFVTLTSNSIIGKQFHANIYSYVAHDCVIGDYVTFAPSVKCNGNVHIEDHAYIGTGAIIKQGQPGKPLMIGRGAVIGMGAVVTRDVPPGVTVVGNPARLLSKD